MTDPVKADYCDTCKHWEPVNGGMGLCRRHAPTRLRIDALTAEDIEDEGETFPGLSEGIWPRTSSDDWCGEWQAPQAAGEPITTEPPR